MGTDWIIEHSSWILLNILYSLMDFKLLTLFLFSGHQSIQLRQKNKGGT